MLNTVMNVTSVAEKPRAFITAEFKFNSAYVTHSRVTLKFSCRVYMPDTDKLKHSPTIAVKYGKFKYSEIAEMVVELLRMVVDSENSHQCHSWRSQWDRRLKADELAARLSVTLKALTNLSFEVENAKIEIVP